MLMQRQYTCNQYEVGPPSATTQSATLKGIDAMSIWIAS